MEPCASEKDEERVGFALDALGLTGLTVASVTDRETGDFGGGGLEAKKTRDTCGNQLINEKKKLCV